MMLSLPFLSRLLASGCKLFVYTESNPARQILADVGIECSCDLEDFRQGKPDLVLLLKPCRNYRAPRHPERWQRVEQLLAWFPGTPFVIPSVHPNEAMSLYIDVYGNNPLTATDAFTFLERFGDGLDLPAVGKNLLAEYALEDRSASRGIAINLSAGTGSRSDRRYVPTELWVQFVERLRSDIDAPVSFVLLAEDTKRRREIESEPIAKRLQGVEIASPPTIIETARWLARRRLLVSPDTGLCHLARALNIPLVTAVPAKLIPYWYPRDTCQETVPTKFGEDLDVPHLLSATQRLWNRHADAAGPSPT